jgi:hypothetical protein
MKLVHLSKGPRRPVVVAVLAATLAGPTALGATAAATPARAAAPGMASKAPQGMARKAPQGMASKALPGVENCGLGPVLIKPKVLVLSCADANSLATSLVWSQWSTSGARASGTFTWNLCKPYCAASKRWGKSTATYVLSDLVDTTKHGWLFEMLTVRITGKQTGGFPRTIRYPQRPLPATISRQ